MEFGSPKWLNALALIPLMALLLVYGARQRRRELIRFTGARMSDPLAPGRSWRKGLLKALLRLGAFTLLVLALARPQFGSQLVKMERQGIDLVIALDVSVSMLAEDMKPNRLERAKQEIIDLIGGLRGDRVGIVAFAGDAFVLCPLTVDYNAALMFANTADVDIVSKQGTAIDKALETSLGLFGEDNQADRAIILVTDGESHDGDPVEAARSGQERGIRVYTIGIGNPGGELIPLRGMDGSVSGYKKDSEGETVLTRLDERTLRQIANVTGGKYLPATREGLELKVLYREIAGLEKKTIEGEFVERKVERFVWFLFGSFVLLGLDAVVRRKGSTRGDRVRLLHTGAASILLFALLGFVGTAHARGIDRERVKSGNKYFEAKEYAKALALYREALGDSTKHPKYAEQLFYNQANALHMMGRYPEALDRYHRSFAEDSLHAGRVLYNRGNTLVEMGKIDEAIESFIHALMYLPDDADARHNLELALKKRAEQEQQQQQQQNDQQDKDRDDRQQGDQQQQSPNEEGQNGEGQEQNDEGMSQQPDSSQVDQPNEADSTRTQPMESIRLTREDALRILRLLEEREKELQKRKRKAAITRSRKGKDW